MGCVQAACLSEDNCLEPEDLKAAVKDFLVNKGGIDSNVNGLAFSAVKVYATRNPHAMLLRTAG